MDRRGVGKVVWQRCFAAFIPELPETFSLGMLKREIHCVHDNELPLLHSIMAHPFLVAELARLSATNDQRCGRLLSKHALEIYLILRTKISLILYLQSRFGMEASLKLIFLWANYSFLVFFNAAIMRVYIFLYESHKFEELFLSPKKALFVKLLKLAQWIYLNYLLFHITLYIKKISTQVLLFTYIHFIFPNTPFYRD